MPATLVRMPKRSKKDDAAPSSPAPAKTPSSPVRIAVDLAEKINLVAKVTKRDVADILSPVVRDFIEREYAKAVKILAERVKPGAAE